MKVASPFAHRIPADMVGNLKWRAAVHKRVIEEPAYADVIRDACSKDPLFFLNGFAWTYDPRRVPFSKLPFILYPFQQEAIMRLINAVGSHDILVEKSRDMGASWLCVSALGWCWLFRAGQSFLFVSRVEEYVDAAGNPKSMFWKLDFLLDNLPRWLRPDGYNASDHRRKLHIENPENGSVVDGESTTGNVARGDRRTAILLDEFAAVDQGHRVLSSTRDATNCRIFNSTPAGTNNAFYDMRQSGVEKLRLHWTEHPLKATGLYTTGDGGALKILDAVGYPADYDPILDGKTRSPWYDNECKRSASLQEIAQELDIDYLGSGYQYFNAATIQELIRKHARPPVVVGDLEYDDKTAEYIRFHENPRGSLRLWMLLDKDDLPPKDHKYVIGVDISAGTGSSNSCASIWDAVTHEKVGEFVNSHIRPEELAKQVVAIAGWLGKAYLVWESGGPGRQFGSRVMELGYGDIYYRKRDEAISGKVSDIPGFASTKETKMSLLGEYRAAVEGELCINRSKDAMEECLEYIFAPDGGVHHSRSVGKIDPSGARANHGDRTIADSLAWLGMKERTRKQEALVPEIPHGCLAWRNKMREENKQPPNRELDKMWN